MPEQQKTKRYLVDIMVPLRDKLSGSWALGRHFVPGIHKGLEVDAAGVAELEQLHEAKTVSLMSCEEMAEQAEPRVEVKPEAKKEEPKKK